MKKTLLSVLLLAALIPASLNFSPAAAVVEKDEGYVSTSVSSTKEISPNQVQITINIETSDKSLQKAADENKIIADKVYSNLKTLLNCEKGDYIKTQNYNANPQYVYNKENKRVLDKYTVTNSVVIKTKNISLTPKLIDTAIAQGATNVNDLQFSTADYDDECNALLADLTKKAYKQADAIAASINSKIIGTKSLGSSCNPENNSPRPYVFMAKAAMDSASSTPIESGKIKIYANIDASFYVK